MGRRGIAAMEFSIIAVPLTTLLLGVFDAGYVITQQFRLMQTLHQAGYYAYLGQTVEAIDYKMNYSPLVGAVVSYYVPNANWTLTVGTVSTTTTSNGTSETNTSCIWTTQDVASNTQPECASGTSTSADPSAVIVTISASIPYTGFILNVHPSASYEIRVR